jgi:arylsulfatase A-like enzyme
VVVAAAVAWWIARERMESPNPARLQVVARLVTTTGSPAGDAADATRHARHRWSAADIESSWVGVRSGSSATYRSPRLDLGRDFHSVAITRPPIRSPMAAPIVLWSDSPVLAGPAFTRNRRELPIAQEGATLVLEAEALQGDRRQPVRHLFLHLPRGGGVAQAVESIAILTTGDLAATGMLSRIAADGETRDGFASTVPLAFRTTVPAGAEILFGVRAATGVTDRMVRVTQSIGSDERVQFEMAVPPGRWVDLRAPLQQARDSTVTFSIAGAGADSVAYWSAPLLLAPVHTDDRPNIVVIVVDALRADVLGADGARASATPVLDDLASKSVLFARAYAPTSWTKPSIATLFTSLYPWTHALGARYYADALPREVLTLQRVLSENGYVTAQFSANPFTSAASGLDRGFDTAFMAPALGHADAFAVTAADIVDRVLHWVSARSRDRSFAYLHLVDAHLARGIDSYRVAAGIADREIGRLLNRLNELRGRTNTLFVITADHGEAFGDHGQAGHGQSVYEEEVRVPLIVHEAGQTAGRIVNEPVHLVDVMPTVLDYAGITLDRAVIQGRSLRASGRELKPSPVIVTRFTYPEDIVVSADRAEMHAIVDFPWKLIVTERHGQPRRHELYRLDTDPIEKDNLATADPTRTRRLEAALDAFLREQATARARFASTHERGVAASPAPPRELVDQLRSLGYVR